LFAVVFFCLLLFSFVYYCIFFKYEADILTLDFTDPAEYRERMISLNPKGLIPMVLGLEDNPGYAFMLKGYQSLNSSNQSK
jgi:hypothetical protein